MILMAETKALPYPGAPILLTRLVRDGEIGDVRIQQFADEQFRVGTFLPGIFVDNPGDTGKVEPEISQWTTNRSEAEAVFFRYLTQASAAGWKEAPDAE